MKTRIIGILLCSSMLTLPLQAQHRLSGKVTDTENTALPLVNVAILNPSDSILCPR